MSKEHGSMADELLVRHLLGEASEDERERVREWLKESEANKKRYYELKLVWDQSRLTSTPSTVNEDEAWQRMQARLADQSRKPKTVAFRPSYKWVRIAAALLLLAGGVAVVWLNMGKENHPPLAVNIPALPAPEPMEIVKAPTVSPGDSAPKHTETHIATNTEKDIVIERRDKKVAVWKKIAVSRPGTKTIYNTKGYICNGTPCPLEICITESVKCRNTKAASYSTCSVLDPNEKGQLTLNVNDKNDKHCALAVQEIKITRMSTGETIVLDANSSPSTAQDMYNYLSGKKKGEILAGNFHTDCDNERATYPLRLDNNNNGNIMMQ